MPELYDLTLDLFYYYTKQGLGVTEIDFNYFDSYWKGLQEKYSPTKNPVEFEKAGINYRFGRTKIIDTDCLHFRCSLKNDDPIWTTIFTLFLIVNDNSYKNSYKIVSLFIKSNTVTKLIEKFDQEIIKLPSDNELYLGSTWMISGWVNCDNGSLQEGFYKDLVGEEWQYKREGRLLGARIIEAWRSRNTSDTPHKGSHVLIVLYPNKDTYIKSLELIPRRWMYLLLYRHKIWYSYQEGSNSKEKIRENFNKIIPFLRAHTSPNLEIHNNYKLSDLKRDLGAIRQILSSYSIDLQAIGIHKETLNTNVDGYKQVLKQFIDKANDTCEINRFRANGSANDFKFLEDFGTIAEIKYERQLEKDYATLAPGLAVLTGLTETIRGLVEVQQAEIDRRSNYIIAIVGLGLAASSAVAGIVATQVYQPDNPKEPPASFSLKNHDIPSKNLLTPTNDRIHWTDGLTYSLVPVGFTALVLFFFWLCGISVRAWSRRTKKPD